MATSAATRSVMAMHEHPGAIISNTVSAHSQPPPPPVHLRMVQQQYPHMQTTTGPVVHHNPQASYLEYQNIEEYPGSSELQMMEMNHHLPQEHLPVSNHHVAQHHEMLHRQRQLHLQRQHQQQLFNPSMLALDGLVEEQVGGERMHSNCIPFDGEAEFPIARPSNCQGDKTTMARRASITIQSSIFPHSGPAVNEPNDCITMLRENDVLMGRGGGTNNYIGNVRFRKLVQEHKIRYLACPKVDKPKVAREVVYIWRNEQHPPGRFLARKDEGDGQQEDCEAAVAQEMGGERSKKCTNKIGETTRGRSKSSTKEGVSDPDPATSSNSLPSSNATMIWYDVGDKKANAKASQCLRERTPEVMPYLQQLREEQDRNTEEGVLRIRQHQQMEKEHESIASKDQVNNQTDQQQHLDEAHQQELVLQQNHELMMRRKLQSQQQLQQQQPSPRPQNRGSQGGDYGPQFLQDEQLRHMAAPSPQTLQSMMATQYMHPTTAGTVQRHPYQTGLGMHHSSKHDHPSQLENDHHHLIRQNQSHSYQALDPHHRTLNNQLHLLQSNSGYQHLENYDHQMFDHGGCASVDHAISQGPGGRFPTMYTHLETVMEGMSDQNIFHPTPLPPNNILSATTVPLTTPSSISVGRLEELGRVDDPSCVDEVSQDESQLMDMEYAQKMIIEQQQLQLRRLQQQRIQLQRVRLEQERRQHQSHSSLADLENHGSDHNDQASSEQGGGVSRLSASQSKTIPQRERRSLSPNSPALEGQDQRPDEDQETKVDKFTEDACDSDLQLDNSKKSDADKEENEDEGTGERRLRTPAPLVSPTGSAQVVSPPTNKDHKSNEESKDNSDPLSSFTPTPVQPFDDDNGSQARRGSHRGSSGARSLSRHPGIMSRDNNINEPPAIQREGDMLETVKSKHALEPQNQGDYHREEENDSNKRMQPLHDQSSVFQNNKSVQQHQCKDRSDLKTLFRKHPVRSAMARPQPDPDRLNLDSNSPVRAPPSRNQSRSKDKAPGKPPKRSLSGTVRGMAAPERHNSGIMSIGSIQDSSTNNATMDPHQDEDDRNKATLEEYQQRLEHYIATGTYPTDGAKAGQGIRLTRADSDDTLPEDDVFDEDHDLLHSSNPHVDEDDDGADSDLEDDWEQERDKSGTRSPMQNHHHHHHQFRKSTPGRTPSARSRGVERHKSGMDASMMSLDAMSARQGSLHSTSLSLFSNLSEDLSAAQNHSSFNRSAGSHLSPTRQARAPGRSLSNQSYLSIMSELTDLSHLSHNMDDLSLREDAT